MGEDVNEDIGECVAVNDGAESDDDLGDEEVAVAGCNGNVACTEGVAGDAPESAATQVPVFLTNGN